MLEHKGRKVKDEILERIESLLIAFINNIFAYNTKNTDRETETNKNSYLYYFINI